MSAARLAAQLLAVDPLGLGGAILAGAPGPDRDGWLGYFGSLMPATVPVKRLPPFIEDDRLLGGLDLAATLSLKRLVIQNGLLAEANGGTLVIPSAERLDPGTAARIAGAMARGEIALERDGATRRLRARFAVIAFDERAAPAEPFPAALEARCAFRLNDLSPGDASHADSQIASARARLSSISPIADDIVTALAGLAWSHGVDSLGWVRLALRAAAAHAALNGRAAVTAEDAAIAARLVLAPRATALPAEADAPPEPPPPDNATSEQQADDRDSAPPPLEDILRESIATALPPGLLAQDGARRSAAPTSRAAGGGGRIRKSPLRGRPLGARAGRLRPGARLSLVDTLRAAAPWQSVRRRDRPDPIARVEVRRADFRIRRFAERREATIVFCVDASGSAAFHRLAEAKGAVELLLAEAYVARTHAALIAFRGQGAETILPPTRSLARAHALLGALPGGGGTPLAQGLDAALQLALAERARGRDPMIVALTDGSANIARDGAAHRGRAAAEALETAQAIAAEGIPAVLVDTAPRPRPDCAALAAAMAARLVALPQIAAEGVAAVVRDVAAQMRG